MGWVDRHTTWINLIRKSHSFKLKLHYKPIAITPTIGTINKFSSNLAINCTFSVDCTWPGCIQQNFLNMQFLYGKWANFLQIIINLMEELFMRGYEEFSVEIMGNFHKSAQKNGISLEISTFLTSPAHFSCINCMLTKFQWVYLILLKITCTKL